MYRSPGSAPLFPASPAPFTLRLVPVSAPAGIFTSNSEVFSIFPSPWHLGHLFFIEVPWPLHVGQTDWVEIPTILPDTAEVTHHPFQGQMDHFVECILEGKESHCNLEDAAISHEIAFAAMKCYETKQPVKLPLMDRQ